jgi:AraC-like DNA-binding protein
MDVSRARLDDQAYEDAIRYCANSILPMHFGEKLINKIFGRNLQSHAAGLLAVMHCEAELGIGERPTLTRIQAEMGRTRTLSGFFALLRFARFIEAVDDAADRRAKILLAKPPLLDGLKTWLSHHMTCAEVAGLLPTGSTHRLKSDEDFALRYIAASRLMLDRVRSHMASGRDAWSWFDGFDCGDRIALALVRAHYEHPGEHEMRWFVLETRQLAERLGISHSHLRNVMNGAEARGFLLQDRRAHRNALTPLMLDDIRDFHLSFWSWVAETADQVDSKRSAA